jgi:hypothetical protein
MLLLLIYLTWLRIPLNKRNTVTNTVSANNLYSAETVTENLNIISIFVSNCTRQQRVLMYYDYVNTNHVCVHA